MKVNIDVVNQIKKRYWGRKQTAIIDESFSKSVSNNSDFDWEGNENNPGVDSGQDLNRIHEVKDISNLNKKEFN